MSSLEDMIHKTEDQKHIPYQALLEENHTLKNEIQSLRARLEEAEELERAISEGDLDALVIPGHEGELIFTLDNADRAYRVLVETMNEGTATLGFDGTILYCNRRFAELLKLPSQAIVGRTIYQFIVSESVVKFNTLLGNKINLGEINLRAAGGKPLPVYISVSSLQAEGSPNAWCIVVTDLTEQKKNEEILAAERLARSIIEQAAETIVVCDTSGRIIRFSNSMTKLCGCDPTFQRFEDLIDLQFSEGADAGKNILPVSSALEGSNIHGMEVTIEDKDCQKLNLILNAGPLKNTEGEIIGCTVTLTDITERKQTEEALLASEARYRSLYENSLDALLLTRPDGTIVSANPQACHMFDMTEEEIIRAGREGLVVMDERLAAAIKERELTGRMRAELTYRRKNGSTFAGEATSHLFTDADGSIKTSMIIRDITERKQLEEEIRQRAEELELVMEVAPVAIWVGHDPQSHNITGNRTANEFYEAEVGENVSANVTPIRRYFREGCELTADELPMQEASLKDIDVRNVELDVLLPSGEYRTMLGSASPLHDAKGHVRGSVGTFIDITERKKAEAKLKYTLDNLDKLVRERTLELEKAYNSLKEIEIARKQEIHHRIKNNLQVISSLLDLQAEKFNNRECIKDSEVLEAFRNSQDRVISMALIHEELYKGGGFETLNFSPYIEELTENLLQTYRVGNIDISLKMDLVENAYFDMDTAVPLGIIVNEIVSNSFKHAFPGRDKGEIQIKLCREKSFESEDCKSTTFVLTVSDNGIGIPEDLVIENLDSLGMQLVTTLVDQLDGELELKRDNGTEFVIRFIVTEKNNQASEPADKGEAS